MTNLDESSDGVYHTQNVFRQLLAAMSEPGRVVAIPPWSPPDPSPFVSPPLASIALTLLDRQVTFATGGSGQQALAAALQTLTWAKAAEPGSPAEYVFIQEPTDAQEIRRFLSPLFAGELLNPGQGALITILVSRVQAVEPTDCPELSRIATRLWRMSGPGIPGTRLVAVSGLEEDWIRRREEMVRDYPMGTDFLLVDHEGHLVGVPRHTTLHQGTREV